MIVDSFSLGGALITRYSDSKVNAILTANGRVGICLLNQNGKIRGNPDLSRETTGSPGVNRGICFPTRQAYTARVAFLRYWTDMVDPDPFQRRSIRCAKAIMGALNVRALVTLTRKDASGTNSLIFNHTLPMGVRSIVFRTFINSTTFCCDTSRPSTYLRVGLGC